jgi:uncharacterized protein (DUF2141 family)
MSKKFLLVVGVILFSIPSFGQNSYGKLKIKIEGLKNKKGSINIAVFKSDEDFKNEKFTFATRIKADSDGNFVFDKVEFGRYAVAIYHDENENSKLDLNFVGIPKEGYGFSNNIKGVLGPPKFKETSFQLNQAETSLSIQLIY